MDKKWPAIALSLTVFPGAGHFLIKKKWRGLFWLTLTLALLVAGVYRFESELINQMRLMFEWDGQFATLIAKTWTIQKVYLLKILAALTLCWLASAADIVWLMRHAEIRES